MTGSARRPSKDSLSGLASGPAVANALAIAWLSQTLAVYFEDQSSCVVLGFERSATEERDSNEAASSS